MTDRAAGKQSTMTISNVSDVLLWGVTSVLKHTCSKKVRQTSRALYTWENLTSGSYAAVPSSSSDSSSSSFTSTPDKEAAVLTNSSSVGKSPVGWMNPRVKNKELPSDWHNPAEIFAAYLIIINLNVFRSTASLLHFRFLLCLEQRDLLLNLTDHWWSIIRVV